MLLLESIFCAAADALAFAAEESDGTSIIIILMVCLEAPDQDDDEGLSSVVIFAMLFFVIIGCDGDTEGEMKHARPGRSTMPCALEAPAKKSPNHEAKSRLAIILCIILWFFFFQE
jgi:hypothetical protein